MELKKYSETSTCIPIVNRVQMGPFISSKLLDSIKASVSAVDKSGRDLLATQLDAIEQGYENLNDPNTLLVEID